MNEIVVKDKFIDYAGVEHPFIIAAIKVSYHDTKTLVVTSDGEDKYICTGVRTGLCLGVSICNPHDEFDEKIGTLKAVGRAKKSEPIIYAIWSSQLNDKVIDCVINDEAKYIKVHPEKYIKGYLDAKNKYLKELHAKELESNFSDIEKLIVDNVKKNPQYLDNVQEYLAYWKGCNKSQN